MENLVLVLLHLHDQLIFKHFLAQQSGFPFVELGSEPVKDIFAQGAPQVALAEPPCRVVLYWDLHPHFVRINFKLGLLQGNKGCGLRGSKRVLLGAAGRRTFRRFKLEVRQHFLLALVLFDELQDLLSNQGDLRNFIHRRPQGLVFV